MAGEQCGGNQGLQIRDGDLGQVSRWLADFLEVCGRAKDANFDEPTRLLVSILEELAKEHRFLHYFVPDLEVASAEVDEVWKGTALSELRGLPLVRGRPGFHDLSSSPANKSIGTVHLCSGQGVAGLALSAPDGIGVEVQAQLFFLLSLWEITSRIIVADKNAAEHKILLDGVRREQETAISQLLSGLAHSMNTPLSTALAATKNLEMELVAGAAETGAPMAGIQMKEIQENLSLIERNLTRTQGLVEAAKRLEGSRPAGEPEEVDLLETVNDAIQMYRHRPKGTKLDISVVDNLDPKCRIWVGRPSYLMQVLFDLLANAETHAYAEAEIGLVKVSLASGIRNDRASFTVRVTDYGAGVTEDAQAFLFEAFYSAGGSSGGLGLSVVKSIVAKSLGGTISCTSTPGHGTDFTLSFSHATRNEHRVVDRGQLMKRYLALQEKIARGDSLTVKEQVELSETKLEVYKEVSERFSGSEKRAAPRIATNRPATLRLADGSALDACLVDISQSGAKHLCDTAVGVGEPVKPTYSNDPLVELPAMVVSCVPVKPKGRPIGWFVAVKFDLLSPQESDLLRWFIARTLVDAAPKS